jgi:hypothetical protein
MVKLYSPRRIHAFLQTKTKRQGAKSQAGGGGRVGGEGKTSVWNTQGNLRPCSLFSRPVAPFASKRGTASTNVLKIKYHIKINYVLKKIIYSTRFTYNPLFF